MTRLHQVSIGEVCDVMTGGTPSRDHPEYFGGDVRWLVSGDVHQGEIFDCEGRITEAGVRNSSAKPLPINSVLIALNGQGKTRGTVALLRTEATCNQSLVAMHPRESSGLLPEFLYANLHSRYQEIRRLTGDSGNDRRGLNMALIKAIQIPLPSLDEQERAVRVVREATDGVAAAEASVRSNLRNARAVFDSYRDRFFARHENWPIARLGDVADVQSGGTPLRSKKEYWDGDIPWYSSGELNAPLTQDPLRRITQRGLEASSAKLFARGSLLIGMYDTAAMKMSILDREAAFNQAVAGVRPNERVDLEFLFFALETVKPEVLLQRRGVRQKNLSLGKIRDIRIPVPAVDVQRDAARELRDVLDETHRLQELYREKITLLDALRGSLMNYVFAETSGATS